MSRTARPVDLVRVAVTVALLIERRGGGACPTLEDIVAHTTIPHRRVWRCIRDLSRTGVIQLEERGARVQRQRRMRAFCGDWTEWTERRPRSGRSLERRPEVERGERRPEVERAECQPKADRAERRPNVVVNP